MNTHFSMFVWFFILLKKLNLSIISSLISKMLFLKIKLKKGKYVIYFSNLTTEKKYVEYR